MFDVAASRGRGVLLLREAGAWGLAGLSSASLPLFFSGSPGFEALLFAPAAGASGFVNRVRTMVVFYPSEGVSAPVSDAGS